jgi:outer membrane protein assembly factor BamA
MEYRVLYTTRGQAELRVSNRTNGFWGSPWEARFEADLQRFLDNYFGGGNSPADSDEVEYIPTGGYAFTSWSRPILPSVNFVTGVRVDAYSISDIARVDGAPGAGAVLGPHVTGYDGGVADQWTVGLEYDTRDNKDVPSTGLHAAQHVGTSLAGSTAWQSAESWLAGYRTLGKHWEFAGKVWQKTLLGDPLFFVEPNLGNEDVLRGVPHKRFRDKSAQSAQLEARFGFPLALPIIRSWLGKDYQIAVFGEAGRVGSDFAEASGGELHYSGGFGGRLIFNDRVGAMRADLGFSEHGMAFIVKFNQAF